MALDDLDTSRVSIDYLARALREEGLLSRSITGSAQPQITRESLKGILIRLPPLGEQRRIAQVLDSVDELRTKRRTAISLLDDLIQSTFLEMFGDPIRNPMSWPTTNLGIIGDVQGGLQLSSARNKNTIAIPYLRVANVYRNKLKLDEIKELKASEVEISRTLLKQGDLLVVEGHGNPQEIGRAAVWDGSVHPCTHQNHLIRVRLDKSKALPEYIGTLINSPSGRRHLLGEARTTSGLNTISVSLVRATPIALPEIRLQEAYVDRVSGIDKLRASHLGQLAELDALFVSVQHRAFRGELWATSAA
jgi:type I restriction enzyme S subunit